MSAEDRIEDTHASVLTEQWPDVGFLGMGVWWGWIWLRYGGVNALDSLSVQNAVSVFYSYMLSTLAIAVVVLLAAVFWQRATALADNRLVVAGFALLAGVATYVSGFVNAASMTVLYIVASTLTGVGTAFLCLRAGRVYGSVPLGESLLNGALSLLLAVAVYFVGEGIPQEWYLSYVSFLPLASAGLFALVGSESFPSAAVHESSSRRATSRERSMIRRLILAASIVAFTAGVGKGITSLAVSSAQFELEGAISVFFVGMASIAVIVLLSRFGVYQGARYAYSTLMVMGIALMLASCFGLSVSYLSIGKETLWFMLSCLMAYMAFKFEASSVRVFGLGQACYFVCSAAGWLVGVFLAPSYADMSVRMMCGVVLAFLVVIVMVYVFPEKSIKQIATWTLWPNEAQGEGSSVAPARLKPVASCGDFTDADDRDARFCEEQPSDIAGRAADPRFGLSERELEVLRLFAQGRSANWIADSLVISKNTVRAHLRAIYSKLDVHSRQELLDFLSGKSAS